MAFGGYPRPSRGGYGGYSGHSGGYSRGHDYTRDPDPSEGGSARFNPEYYEREQGYRFEGTRSSVVDPFEPPQAKRRKIDNITICVDFVRGYCMKGARCPKPHVDYVESIDEREIMAKLKFCHDYQNKGMCSRRDCKFLHVTRREEDEFLLTGTIPQAVFVRMREWTTDNSVDSNYSSFGGASPNRGHPSAHSRGRSPSFNQPYTPPRAPVARHRGDTRRQSASGPGYLSGTGHSMSQPVTYSNYCVDFLKGTCTKGQNCMLSHVETVDDPTDRSGIVKQVFCHDFQNMSCKRPFCKFIHASRQEEEFFTENGYFPPSLNARNRDKMFYSDVCIDYLRNQCVRGQQCQYKHVDKVEAHNERICLSRSIFCHDHQEGGCNRPTCKLVHTGKPDEQYFLRTGSLPDYLKVQVSSGPKIDVSHLAGNVCREYVKNQCSRGASCRYYHPSPAELRSLLSQQKGLGGIEIEQESPQTKGEDYQVLLRENQELKARIQQFERLLADACHCITLAVGDQNPAIATLMKTIAEMAPASSLANQSGIDVEGTINGAQTEETEEGIATVTAKCEP